MIILEDKQLDIFKVSSQTITVPVNKVSVMGNGLARAFKERYEGLFEAYKQACQFGVFASTGFYVYTISEDKKILCFPTKNHWKDKSPIELIDHGLEMLARNYSKHGITSIALPALGCGKGQKGRGNTTFTWDDIRPLIYEYLDPLPLPVTLIPPR